MCPASGDERAQRLGRRVRWLDRYRRAIASVIAIGVLPLTMWRLDGFLGAEWPGFHVTLLAVIASVFAWWLVEVGLAWMTAVWETEHDQLTRDPALPRAEVLDRRK
jgi:hypothetical protein